MGMIGRCHLYISISRPSVTVLESNLRHILHISEKCENVSINEVINVFPNVEVTNGRTYFWSGNSYPLFSLSLFSFS